MLIAVPSPRTSRQSRGGAWSRRNCAESRDHSQDQPWPPARTRVFPISEEATAGVGGKQRLDPRRVEHRSCQSRNQQTSPREIDDFSFPAGMSHPACKPARPLPSEAPSRVLVGQSRSHRHIESSRADEEPAPRGESRAGSVSLQWSGQGQPIRNRPALTWKNLPNAIMFALLMPRRLASIAEILESATPVATARSAWLIPRFSIKARRISP